MGGQPRYPYPKTVWSPSGGWWSQPVNWKSNTAIVVVGMGIATYGLWRLSAEREQRHSKPLRWIPSQLWSKQFRDGEWKLNEKDKN